MPQCKILVIDDEKAILEIFEYFLESEGYVVKTSPSPENIIEQISAFEPSVILMDVVLQHMKNGKELCQMIKAEKKFAHIPIVLMSASHIDEADLIRCSADAMLEKPFNLEEVRNLISDVIEKKGVECDKQKNEARLARA